MIGIIKSYEKNKNEIERFILDNIYHNGVISLSNESLERFFQTFNALQLIYTTDKEYKQESPSFSRASKDLNSIGRNRKNLFKAKKLNEHGEYISSPYLCTVTSKMIITFIKKIDDNYVVMDFNIVTLLEDLGFLHHAIFFEKFNKFVYGLIGYGLTALSLILVIYAITSFGHFLFYDKSLIETTFKAIISLTLGLAIFDLGRNLLEHEVVYKDNNPHEKSESKMFIKFLISIITALSIESLMLVLKIALTKEYSSMVYAVWLIMGISFMIATLAIFYNYTSKEKVL